MTRKEAARKKELEALLFERHTLEERKANIRRVVRKENVAEFLQLAAISHQAYFQYTTLNSFKGMLRSGTLHLTAVRCLNDLLECKSGDATDRTFIASFGFGYPESVAMWWMYGFNGNSKEKAIRLRFNAKNVQAAFAKIQCGGKHPMPIRGGSNDDKATSKAICSSILNVSFHDVMYQYGRGRDCANGKRKCGSIFWNGRVAGEIRCKAFSDATEEPYFSSFVKDYAWAYENETRLVVTIADKVSGLDWIEVPFADAISTASITAWPSNDCSTAAGDIRCREIADVIRQSGKAQGVELGEDFTDRISPSKYPIKFKK